MRVSAALQFSLLMILCIPLQMLARKYYSVQLPETLTESYDAACPTDEMMERILYGLENGKPDAFADVLARDYQEIQGQPQEGSGYVILQNGKRYVLARPFIGRDDFLQRVNSRAPLWQEPVEFRIVGRLPQGDAVDYTIEAVAPAGKSLGMIRLSFSLKPDGWRLVMSDGLSLLATKRRPAHT